MNYSLTDLSVAAAKAAAGEMDYLRIGGHSAPAPQGHGIAITGEDILPCAPLAAKKAPVLYGAPVGTTDAIRRLPEASQRLVRALATRRIAR